MIMAPSKTLSDRESSMKQTACFLLNATIEDMALITRRHGTTWFADIVRINDDSERKESKEVNTSFLSGTGSTFEDAVIKLHEICSEAAYHHVQLRGFKPGPEPRDGDGRDYSDDEDDESAFSDSDDEDLLLEKKPAARPRIVPVFERPSTVHWPAARLQNAVPRTIPNAGDPSAPLKPKLRPVNTTSSAPRGTPLFPRITPPVSSTANSRQPNGPPASSPPFPYPRDPRSTNTNTKSTVTLPARIRIDFLNHGVFEIAETIPMTPGDVLTAATRHCDMLTGAKCLRASLKSVTRGGTKVHVQGCVLDLAGIVGALPEKGEVPVFDVEVTKGPVG